MAQTRVLRLKVHVIIGRCLALAGPTRSDLDALCHHSGIGYAISGLVEIGQDIDLGPDANGAKVALVASIGLLCDLAIGV